MSLNKVLIMGNLTRDTELKITPSGAKVCNFSVATNFVYKDPQGTRKEIPEYHNIVVWNQQAENCHKYLKKGSSVFIEGRIQTRSWEGQDGKKQYRTEIIADNVRFLGTQRTTPNTESQNTYADPEPFTHNTSSSQQKSEEFDVIDFDAEPNIDDIPF